MKYHQLKAFVTVAEEGSIRAAARRLNVSPAALTKAVKELEIALGVSLVVRTARGVQLTAFGQQLQVRARLIVAEMQRARDDIEQAQGAMTGRRGGDHAGRRGDDPARRISRIPAPLPGGAGQPDGGFPGVALPRLHDGSLDFAVAVVVPELLAAEFDHAGYASRSLIVARKGHPLASATSLAELVEADWLMNPSPESSTQVLFNSFVAYGLPVPARVVECPSFSRAQSDDGMRPNRVDARAIVAGRMGARPARGAADPRAPAGRLGAGHHASRQPADTGSGDAARLPA